MKSDSRILIVDDDEELCELLSLRIEAKGGHVGTAFTKAQALDRFTKERWDVALLDLRLGADDGLDVLDALRSGDRELPVIVLTAHGTIETAVEAMRRGAFGFVTKPFHDHDLLQKIEHAVDSHRLRCEVASLRRIVGGETVQVRIFGVSPAIEDIRRLIARVGPSEATVLILGESGTGKELVARALHAASPRSKGPFVAVNCAGLVPELLESTLFGHVRGAFTGAVGDREGLFGAARRGTLFLDELGEMPLSVQAKLLRVLEERSFMRVGATVEERTDARVVAATNRDLRQEVAEKRFREDLFYRLHVVPMVMPPLRERREDIPLLASMFLERAAARNGRHASAVPRLRASALAALMSHAWPGNVRELAHVMEAAVLLSLDEIDVEHLPGVDVGLHATAAVHDANFAYSLAQVLSSQHASGAPLPTLREARDVWDRAYLEACLAEAKGNVAAAARLAGRNRTDFYDLLRRHGMSPGGRAST
jgi:two-component system response regulator GlrR